MQLSDDLVRAGASFSKWSEKQIEVLDSLPLCGNLLAWLRDNIKDRSDLKTFYDLATISAGESDHELDRVSHFYQAVSGYAPLILDLPQADSTTFTQFQAAAEAVFNALAVDPHLAIKLVDSNRNLEWIKACKDQQGSVEQSSLTLVAKINQTGIFQLGLPPTKKQVTTTTIMMEDCIKVFYHKVTSNNEEERMQELTLAELKELNSKLMLITAGTDGKRDVERFSRILGLVERLGRHFIDLLNAGCHLFSQWTMKVQKRRKKTQSCILQYCCIILIITEAVLRIRTTFVRIRQRGTDSES